MPVGWLIEVLKLSVEELLSKEPPTKQVRGQGRVPAQASRRRAIR
jgi:hypothetical protein